MVDKDRQRKSDQYNGAVSRSVVVLGANSVSSWVCVGRRWWEMVGLVSLGIVSRTRVGLHGSMAPWHYCGTEGNKGPARGKLESLGGD